jgi:hypothetical protein
MTLACLCLGPFTLLLPVLLVTAVMDGRRVLAVPLFSPFVNVLPRFAAAAAALRARLLPATSAFEGATSSDLSPRVLAICSMDSVSSFASTSLKKHK